MTGFGLLMLAMRWLNSHWPFDIFREIVEERNYAVAILIGAILLGLSGIISAAVFYLALR